MSEKRILIAEDDVSTGVMLFEFFKAHDFTVEAVKNGREALDRYNENPSQVIITDIEMPEMDGIELIGHLNRVIIPPVIFVTTSHKDPELIIDIMKKGVYDYILKPLDLTDLLLKITRAFEAYEMKRVLKINEKEKMIRLENSLEWYRFEEKIQSRDLRSMGDSLFQSLLTSFNQGSGFGGLVTLMTLMKDTAVKDEEYYKIPNDFYEMIMTNVESAERAMQIFGDIAKISSGKHHPEKISAAKLHEKISAGLKEMQNLTIINNQRFLLCDKKGYFNDTYVEINIEHFMKVLREIAVNALKFSPPESDVVIIFLIDNGYLNINFINDINSTDKEIKGIPLGYENLVFEPFFRLTKNIYDKYKSLDYGLGLTLVQRIISSYSGKVEIGNITDYTDIKGGAKTRVECSVKLKIISGN